MRAMLSTSDNPYDPFTQFDEWQSYDESQGYNSCGYLARIALLSPSLSPDEQEKAVEDAIDEIVSLNPIGIYIKVTEND